MLSRYLSRYLSPLLTIIDLKQYADNKGYCEDFSEGKFSFPIVHSIRADTTNRQILSQYSFFRHSTPLLTNQTSTTATRHPSRTSIFTITQDVRRQLHGEQDPLV